jgi:hypothetical protein
MAEKDGHGFAFMQATGRMGSCLPLGLALLFALFKVRVLLVHRFMCFLIGNWLSTLFSSSLISPSAECLCLGCVVICCFGLPAFAAVKEAVLEVFGLWSERFRLGYSLSFV